MVNVSTTAEGGSQDGTIDQCENLSGPVVELNRRINSRVDGIVTGHTHSSFNCTLTDWKGGQRPVAPKAPTVVEAKAKVKTTMPAKPAPKTPVKAVKPAKPAPKPAAKPVARQAAKVKAKPAPKAKKGRSGNPAKRAAQEPRSLDDMLPGGPAPAMTPDDLPDEFRKLLGG